MHRGKGLFKMCRLNLAICFQKMTSYHIRFIPEMQGWYNIENLHICKYYLPQKWMGKKKTSLLHQLLPLYYVILSLELTNISLSSKYSPPSHYLTYKKHLTQLITLPWNSSSLGSQGNTYFAFLPTSLCSPVLTSLPIPSLLNDPRLIPWLCFLSTQALVISCGPDTLSAICMPVTH